MSRIVADEILEESDASKFDPKQIYHYVFSIYTDGGKIEFNCDLRQIWNIEDIASIDEVVSSIISSGKPVHGSPLNFLSLTNKSGGSASNLSVLHTASQLDIKIHPQCWVILQLNAASSDWQFSVEELPVRTDKKQMDKIFNLSHAKAGSPTIPGEVVVEGVQVCRFGVGEIPVGSRQPVNFHVEFLIRGAGGQIVKRTRVIFDPDVKNDGGPPNNP